MLQILTQVEKKGGGVSLSQKDISMQTTPCSFVLQAKASKSQQNMQDWEIITNSVTCSLHLKHHLSLVYILQMPSEDWVGSSARW